MGWEWLLELYIYTENTVYTGEQKMCCFGAGEQRFYTLCVVTRVVNNEHSERICSGVLYGDRMAMSEQLGIHHSMQTHRLRLRTAL